MNGRVYNPTLARFVSADPYIPHPDSTQSYNRYSYVQNNSMNRTDPTGFEDSGDDCGICDVVVLGGADAVGRNGEAKGSVITGKDGEKSYLVANGDGVAKVSEGDFNKAMSGEAGMAEVVNSIDEGAGDGDIDVSSSGGEQMTPVSPTSAPGNTLPTGMKNGVQSFTYTIKKSLVSLLGGKNPSREEVVSELSALSIRYEVPEKALVALVSAESDFRQFDRDGQPLVSPNPNSSAAGLGQVTRTTAKLYKESYDRLLTDWRYNLAVSVKIYAAGYHHKWNRDIKDQELRASRAYGNYHDGFPREYKTNKGYIGTAWEKRYRSRY